MYVMLPAPQPQKDTCQSTVMVGLVKQGSVWRYIRKADSQCGI